MNPTETTSGIEVMRVLRECGWVPDPDRTRADGPTLKYDFGNFELSAAVFFSERFCQAVVFLKGGPNCIAIDDVVAFEIAEFVESREQAIALIWYCIRRHRPAIVPTWLEEGKDLQHLLPWRREAEAYARRPKAVVDRVWMRPLGQRLREAAIAAVAEDRCVVHFDGTTVRFDLPERRLIVQADGPEPWVEPVTVSLQALTRLPKRWMKETVEISLWDGHLLIGNVRFQTAPVKGLSSGAQEFPADHQSSVNQH